MIFHDFREALGSGQESPGSGMADWGRWQWLYFVGFKGTLVIGTFSQVHPERTLPGVPRRGSGEPSEVPSELLGCPQGTLVGRKGSRGGPWEASEGH